MDAAGALGLAVLVWLVLSVPIGILAGSLIRRGHDGET